MAVVATGQPRRPVAFVVAAKTENMALHSISIKKATRQTPRGPNAMTAAAYLTISLPCIIELWPGKVQ